MTKHKTPPRGYRMLDYPLPHEFQYGGTFDFLDLSKDATMITILRSSETTTGVEAVEVNPRHAAFAEETGPTIANGSIVPRISFTLRASLSQATTVDNEFGAVQFHMLPIYTAFLDSMEASDDKTGEDVEGILELATSATAAKRVQPLFSGTNLTNGLAQPVNTVLDTEVFGDYGLTTDLVLESVAFTQDDFYDAMQYYTNGGMLKKVSGSIKTWTLSRDRRAMYHSNNFTNPTVKRGNAWMFCGVLLWTSIPGVHSFGIGTDFNGTDLDLVHFNLQIRFDEWNPNFDQTTV